MCNERHGKSEMKPRGVAHECVACRKIGMHGEGRLHICKGGDDYAPNALYRIKWQDAFVPSNQPSHHLRFARGPEGRCAGILASLDGDQSVDNFAALDQKLVHSLIDAIDLLA